MKNRVNRTAPLGELIAAVYDNASRDGEDPRDVLQLVFRTVTHMIENAPKIAVSRVPSKYKDVKARLFV